jgi:hypothetical protein
MSFFFPLWMNKTTEWVSEVLLLPELVTLQGGGLQKWGGLWLALGYWVYDVLAKKNFRTQGGRDQESLLIKQDKGKIETVHSPDMGVGTSDNRCKCSNRSIYGEKVGWGLAQIYLSVLTLGIITCFCCYPVLSIGPKDFKVGQLIYGSQCLNILLNKGWSCQALPLTGNRSYKNFPLWTLFVPRRVIFPWVLSQDKRLSLRYPCSGLKAHCFLGKGERSEGESSPTPFFLFSKCGLLREWKV